MSIPWVNNAFSLHIGNPLNVDLPSWVVLSHNCLVSERYYGREIDNFLADKTSPDTKPI